MNRITSLINVHKPSRSQQGEPSAVAAQSTSSIEPLADQEESHIVAFPVTMGHKTEIGCLARTRT